MKGECVQEWEKEREREEGRKEGQKESKACKQCLPTNNVLEEGAHFPFQPMLDGSSNHSSLNHCDWRISDGQVMSCV